MIQTVSAASSAKRQDEALTTLHEIAQAKYQKIVSNNYIYINVYECMCVLGAVNCSKTKGQVLKKKSVIYHSAHCARVFAAEVAELTRLVSSSLQLIGILKPK